MSHNDTPYTDPRAAEARRLRTEEGLTSAQIRERLGVEKAKLQYWLAGLPGNKSSLRARAKDHLREPARELRRQGKTYDEIVTELGVSRSSVSLWVRDIPPPQACHPSWTPEARAKREVRTQRRRRAKIEARKAHREDPLTELFPLGAREALITGAIAYWCEGAKWKEWMPAAPGVTFINSDPGLVRLFLRFLDVVPVQFGDLRYRLSIHETASEAKAHAYWARELGIRMGDFSKTNWKKHNPKTVRKNTGEDYHGCLSVTVLRSKELYAYLDRVVATTLRALAARPNRDWSVCGHGRGASS